MDIQKLERLQKLKENGILTKEEFELQKKEILSNKPVHSSVKKGFSWKNFILSFGVALIVFVLEIAILGNIEFENAEAIRQVAMLCNFICAVVLIGISYSIGTKKYKEHTNPFVVFIAVLGLGPLAVWVFSYDLLKIKTGRSELK